MSSKVAALYIRVSTEDQTELSPDAQKRLLLDYAQKNDMIVSGDFIFTESVSGRHAQKRPEFQKMIALAKQPSHPIDVILVWKFSRFARNQEESIVYKSMLKKDNVDVISVSEPLIEGPFGSLIERIIEWMDEYYSIRLSGEVLRGMKEKALQKGYQVDTLEEYKNNKDRLVSDRLELTAALSQLLQEEQADQPDTEEILKEIRSVADVLKNPDVGYEEKGNLIRSVVEQIIYDKESGKMSFDIIIS